MRGPLGVIQPEMVDRVRKRPVDRRSFNAVLKELSRSHPTAAAFLHRAERNRTVRLKHWRSGARMRGYEELIAHLAEVAEVYQRNRKLRPVAFLIDRAQADFVTALEATLSGFHTVAHDAMRDVMEIEFLLRDFFFEPDHIQEWISASQKHRNNKFRPAVLRQRHAARVGVKPEELGESADYRGHSMFLHVTPYRHPFGQPGITDGNIAFSADSGFWEIFEHGRRLLFAVHRLRRKLAPHLRSPWGPERGLKKFREGWQRTQEWQAIFRALIGATRNKGEGDDA